VRRSLLTLAVLTFSVVTACSSGPVDAEADLPGTDVIDVSGALDAAALDFMVTAIEDAAAHGQELVLLQVNSPAALDGDGLNELIAVLANPPLPVAVWLGPAPAVAYGGVADLVLRAPVSAAAPNTTIGRLQPLIAGSGPIGDESEVLAQDTDLDLQPTLRQYLQDLDGRVLSTESGDVTLSTLRDFEQDGVSGVTLRTVTLRKPPLTTRFFRLAVTPEAAFFFLVVGLTLVTFEFFALGPGVAAGVAALSLWLGGWGIVNLPVRWWAVAIAVSGWALLTAAYQRGGVFVLTVLGAVLLQVGGAFYVDGSRQIDTRWWLILLSVLAALFFFLLAMPTVQRSRLSTQTIGRDDLIGRPGVATSDFGPEGTVEVGGARWNATAHREAGLVKGSPIVVTGVDGLFLEVDPAPTGNAKAQE